ncbi:MAG: tRNA (guanosine(37)-N1)-methyltransferase TrmD [Actinomycetota bacterium]|nr:tRNA (guanosine(37)-N1)-methyltransferase TrmD [Actinomycetota bacterium]
MNPAAETSPSGAELNLDVVTIFPEYLAPLRQSLVGRAIGRGRVALRVHDLRRWTDDAHRTVDDQPYGGGPGMIMRPEPWGRALDELVPNGVEPPLLVLPTPTGRRFTQALAADLAGRPWLLFGCGRYEGIDARVAEDAARRMPVVEISLGDYVLAGGEVAVLAIVEAVVRLRPGVLGNAESATQDSFSDGRLEGPAYTRPPSWRGLEVPPVLRSGDHQAIARWRREEAERRTRERRPDLLGPPA